MAAASASMATPIHAQKNFPRSTLANRENAAANPSRLSAFQPKAAHGDGRKGAQNNHEPAAHRAGHALVGIFRWRATGRIVHSCAARNCGLAGGLPGYKSDYL